jgi:hypothetical protein
MRSFALAQIFRSQSKCSVVLGMCLEADKQPGGKSYRVLDLAESAHRAILKVTLDSICGQKPLLSYVPEISRA